LGVGVLSDVEQLREQEGQGAKFHPQPPMGPLGSWDGLKGPPKKQIGDLRGEWVGQWPKKDQGSDFPPFLLMVFLNSPHRETPKKKKVIKKNQKNRFYNFWSNFLFDTIVL
jgi:hypothetical protein